MLGVFLRDRKQNTTIQQKTNIKDIIEAVAERKYNLMRHIADNRWVNSSET